MLYGDNAIGGVINIVTKTGVGGPPVYIRGEAGYGSFNQRTAELSTAVNSGPWTASFYGNGIKSDGYRVNNALDQRNGVGNLNYTTPDLKAFLTVTGDDQKLGFPGGRIVDPSIGVNELVTDRRGAATPFDYGNQQGASATTGFTKTLLNGVDLIVDGGYRKKDTQSGFFGTVPFASPFISFSSTFNDAALQQWSITPRLSVKNSIFGIPSTDPDRHRLLRCHVPPGTRRVQRGSADPHLRPVAAVAGRLLAADGWPVADNGLRLRRPRAKHLAECA